MKTLTTLTAVAALTLAGGAVQAQTPYRSTQSQPQQQDTVGAILGALFGDRIGASTSVDAQWAAGRLPLAQQRTQFDTRIDADVRAGSLSSSAGQRAKSEYAALVDLEARYGADRRFTTQERTELNDRYGALTQVLAEGGYADGGVSGGTTVADGRAEFDTRVDAAVRARRLTRTEATRLKADYQALATVEAGYLRDGSLSTRERDDLETRLDALDARVGDVGTGGSVGATLDPRARLDAIARALPASGLSASAQAQMRVEHEDLMRLESAYARLNASADERAYLERRLTDLETRARVTVRR